MGRIRRGERAGYRPRQRELFVDSVERDRTLLAAARARWLRSTAHFSPPAFTKVTARQAEDAEIAERRTKNWMQRHVASVFFVPARP